MKWNTQRKAVVAALALAGAALCVDRFVLGYGPRAAQAGAPVGTIAGASAPASSDEEASRSGKPALRTVSLAERVARLVPESERDGAGPDAFAVPASWVKLVLAGEKPADKSGAGTKSPDKEGESFTLSSVVAGPNVPAPAARINGRLIRVGEKINGHELIRIEREPGRNFVAVLRGSELGSEIRVPLVIGGENAPPPGPDAPGASPSGARS